MRHRAIIFHSRNLCNRAASMLEHSGDLQDYAALLQSCRDLGEGKRIHDQIVASGLDQHLFLGNCLINMYVRCGSLADADATLWRMNEKNVVSWTAVISGNAQAGQFHEAFALFRRMLLESSATANSYTLVAMLNACGVSLDLPQGRSIHAIISELGLESETLVANALLNMYAKCRSLEDAMEVFMAMPQRDVVSWTAMLGALAQERFYSDAMRIFREMLLQPLAPNVVTFVTVLGACSSGGLLEEGKWIHSLLHEAGLGFDPLAGNALIHMYGRCGSWSGAYAVFESMGSRHELDLVSWNAMICASAEAGRHGEAMAIFRRLYQEGMPPNSVTFVAMLNSLASRGGGFGSPRSFFVRVWESGYSKNVVVCNAVINMYIKCRYFAGARKVFRGIKSRCDVISWNAMLGANEDPGSVVYVVKTFYLMLLEGVTPNMVSFTGILNACANSAALEIGRKIHGLILTRRSDYLEISLATLLVYMYGKCGYVDEAELVFKNIPDRNLVAWNSMLGVYAQNDRSKEAFQLLVEMLQGGVIPDALSFTSVLRCCCCLQQAKVLQACISETGYQSACLETALISMHGKCENLEQARKLFHGMNQRDVISWTTMVSAAAENKEFKEVQHLFRSMQLEGVIPDKFTFATILDTCLDLTSLGLGKLIHACVTEIGFEADLAVDNALLNMYANCGDLADTITFFDKMTAKDLVSWNAMNSVYAQHGLGKEATLLFRQLQLEGVKPDKFTFAMTLNVSASLGVLADGKFIHALAVESGHDSDVSVATGLVKLYSRCGKLDEARTLFEGARDWTVMLLNSIIAALAQHGFSREAVKMFWKMQQQGVRPDAVTLVSIISACSHAGMVEQGCSAFYGMNEFYGISQTVDHYNCFVDLLGRAGQLEMAEQIIHKMPFQDNALVWTTLLGTCKLQGDAVLGKRCAERILELDPHNSAAHVVLSNIYCAAGKWKDAVSIRKKLLDDKLTKAPGMSWIQVGNQVHEFVVGDRSHPRISEIYDVLDKLEVLMRGARYEPDKKQVLQDVEDKLKKSYHSERLAISFGLIATPAETPLRIMKNLSVCIDCHTAIKYIATIVKREIIVRDSLRFHHFKDGVCSCKDYW